jgi:predicted ATPase
MSNLADPLPGRARELERLRRAIDSLDHGPAEILVLVGEPGIGKSRLIAEALSARRTRDRLVLPGRPSEFERDLPFGVFVDALDPYLGSVHPSSWRALTDTERSQLANVFPALESVRSARLHLLLAAGEREDAFERLQLGPLSRDEAETLLATVGNRELQDWLFAESGGNPFYL